MSIARSQFGMSFGQYCGSVLIKAMKQGAQLPTGSDNSYHDPKASAIATIKGIASLPHNADIGHLSDSQIKDMIASRYA